jgi:hypothetical protein
MIAFAPFYAREIDAFQEHDEVGGTDLNAGLSLGRRGEAKGSDLQSLDAGITMPSFLWRYTNSVESIDSGFDGMLRCIAIARDGPWE